MIGVHDWSFYWEAGMRLCFPAYCGACGLFLRIEEKGVCGSCEVKMRLLGHSPEEAILENDLECVGQAWAVFDYVAPVKDLLTEIKFGKKRWLLRIFSKNIREMALAISAENHYDALLPVPVSRATRIRREFNQAELIAAEFHAAARIPVKTDLLQKSGPTIPQSRLSGSERRINAAGAFRVPAKRRLDGGSFLLMDDIITTGATAEEAARVLKNHGAARVDLFALARTPRNS
jgi:ComF family protein